MLNPTSLTIDVKGWIKRIEIKDEDDATAVDCGW
jgi:hypothetical protein